MVRQTVYNKMIAVRDSFGGRESTSTVIDDNRAQSGNLTGLIIGLLVAGLMVIDVFIPTINQAISNSNMSGQTLTIAGLLPLFAVLLLLIALASPLMGRVRG